MLKNQTIRKFIFGVSFLVALFVNFPIIFFKLPFISDSFLAIADIVIQIVICQVYSILAIYFTYKNARVNFPKAKQIWYGVLLYILFVITLSGVNMIVLGLPTQMISTVVMRGFFLAIIAFFFSRFLIVTDKKNEILVENEHLKHENLLNQLTSLKNQINPHFLFNSLNTLSWLINEDKEKSQLYLQKLSQVLRYSLSIQDQSLVNLTEELSLTDSYIFLLQMRFGENIKVIKKLDGMENFKIPPHSLQLLIENAIKHNVVTSNQPLTISIEVNNVEKIISISNSTRLKTNSAGTGIGLINLSERFKIIVGREIEICQNQEFTVVLPLVNK